MDHGSELFRWFVEASTDGLWLLDEQGRTIFANPRMAQLLGRDVDEMVGFSVRDALDADGRRQVGRHLADMVGGLPGAENIEIQLLDADGNVVWVLVSWHPVHNDAGERVGWLHRVTEYTERKTLLETLQVREQQLTSAQQIAHLGSWEWDVTTDTVTWSDELYRIFNLAPGEFAPTYQGFLDFTHPEDRAVVQDAVMSTFEGADEFTMDSRIVRTDGEVRWIRGLGRVERGPDGSPVLMSGTSQDITVLVTAGELAAEATRRLHLLQLMATSANQAASLAEAVRKAAAGLAQHTSWVVLAVYHVGPDGTMSPEELPRDGWDWVAADDELAERVRRSGRVAASSPAGRGGAYTMVGIPILLHDRVVCVIEAIADQPPPGAASDELITQITGHLSRVAEREHYAGQLAEARDQAMEASRLKSEFLATMSHEIRTPMNGVIGLNELLMRTELDDHQRRLTEGLQSAGLTLLAIIDDILDLSKIEAGKLELEEADFDVRSVFDRVADLLGGTAAAKGLALVVSCHRDLPERLRGDSVRLGQVVSNLVSNAIKFTDSGEVVVQAQVERGTDDGKVVLRVTITDTGVGIPGHLQDGLFDPFTQADPSTTRRHGGTGLGLAISRRLVDALGGDLTVTSEVGRGSSFTFSAVLGPATSQRPSRPQSPNGDSTTPRTHLASPAAPAAELRVLVVEDNEVNQMVATGLLESLGYDSDVVQDGIEAVERLAHPHDYAVVLMDCRMPRLDGYDATRRIRQQESSGSRVPVIAMTASAIAGERERCLAAGMDDFLTKPIERAQLDAALRRWAAGHDSPVAAATKTSLAGGVLDAARVQMLSELTKDGVSFFERTATSFTARADEQVVAIRDAVEDRDAVRLRAAAHQLKGSALNLGLPRVGEAADRLEALGAAGGTAGAEPLLDRLAQEVERALDALGEAVDRTR